MSADCVRVMCVRERREMMETEIKDKKRKRRQRGREDGSYRTFILGNWGVSALLRENEVPHYRLVPGNEMIDEKEKQQ